MSGPRLYRFYNYEEKQALPAPTGGWNPDASPSELAQNQAPILDNFLIRPGKVVPRGAFSVFADLSAAAPLNVCGIHPHLGDTQVIISQKAASATAFVDPWNAPIIRPAAAAALAAPSTTVIFAQGGTTRSNVVTTAAKVPGPRGITFEGVRYYIGYGTASAPVLDDGGTYFAQSTSLCTQTGAGFTELTLAPHGALDLKSYLSRIWLLGGIDTPGAGTTFNPLQLFFTNPIVSGGGAASADWKDPVSGLVNKLRMDGDSYDPGVGLATAADALLVFRYQSIWSLRGSTTKSFTLIPVSREVGCIDARSIVETDTGVYFLSQKGLMFTDGAGLRNVSGPVTQTIQNAVGIYTGAILSSFGGYATCARASDGKIVVSIGIAAITSAAPDGHNQPIWCGLFDPATGTWVRLTSPIWALDGTITAQGNNYPGWAVSLPDRRLITVGDKYITYLEAPGTPANAAFIAGPALPTAATSDASNSGVFGWTSPANVESDDGSTTLANTVELTGTNTTFTGTSVSRGSSTAWTNPNNAATADGNLALAITTSGLGGITDYLKTSGQGFSIPSSATITGISVAVSRQANAFGAVDDSVKIVKAGVITGNEHANHSAEYGRNTLSTAVYGSDADLWGAVWTPADINAANFGVAFSASNGGGSGTWITVDVISITVYYTVPTQYLKATGFGFAVPTAATITGIKADVKRRSAGATTDSSVRLYKAGVLTGTDKASGAAWPAALATATYGGSGDLWGAAWTAADINNANFGVAVAANDVTHALETNEIDSIMVTVYYQYGAATSALSFVQTSALYDKMADGTFSAIPVKWTSRLAPLVAESQRLVISKRWFLDYLFQGVGVTPTTGWTMTTNDARGTQYAISTTPVGSGPTSGSVTGGTALPSPSIQRQTTDITTEIQDASFTVSWSDISRNSAPTNVIAELYGIGMEFQPARQTVTGG